MDKLTYEDFIETGTIRKLSEVEKNAYVSFHEKIWKEDLETAKQLVEKSPRWSIIAGYYAMHDLAKLFLAKKFNLKISGKFDHAATIEALKRFLKNKDAIKKFEDALEAVPVELLPEYLELGKRERAKSQYYTRRFKEIDIKNAIEFLKEVVEPFVKTLEGLL